MCLLLLNKTKDGALAAVNTSAIAGKIQRSFSYFCDS